MVYWASLHFLNLYGSYTSRGMWARRAPLDFFPIERWWGALVRAARMRDILETTRDNLETTSRQPRDNLETTWQYTQNPRNLVNVKKGGSISPIWNA